MTTVVKKKDGRGGYRPGAGRKKEALSVTQVKEMRKKAKEWAKKLGKDIDDILLEFIHGQEIDGTPVKISQRDRIACIKLWKDYSSPKISEGGEADKLAGPAVYLPEQRDKIVSIK